MEVSLSFKIIVGVVCLFTANVLTRSQDLDSFLADSDADNDGLTLLQEVEAGSDPYQFDTDGDGVPDGLDGWALEPAFAPPRLPSLLNQKKAEQGAAANP